jgi:hypothetical protein
MRLVLFGAGIATNLDRPFAGQKAVSAGGQLDCKLVLFSTLSSTLSFGYAVAAEEHQRRRTEFMISLKLL